MTFCLPNVLVLEAGAVKGGEGRGVEASWVVVVKFRVLSIENEVMFPGSISKSIFTGVAEPGVGIVEPGPL